MQPLRELVVKGTIWTFASYGINQVLRLGTNLILTRLLIPEIFGLSALITTFMIGLEMFSDLGIGASIIQNDRGEDPVFLNTAWTIQVLRGIALWLCSCLGSWPFARFYGEPQLGWLITVAGLSALIAGFNSTGIFTAKRRLRLERLSLVEIGAKITSVAAIIAWALVSPTIWAIVTGGLVGRFILMLGSHVWLSEVTHKFTWDKNSARSLAKFGRWIFISTVLGFLAQHIDKLILGKFLSLKELGLYSIASMIAISLWQLFSKTSQQVLFPLFSKLKELPPNELRKKVVKLRIRLMTIFLPPLLILVIFGQDLITLLLDPRYQEAGWILQTLSAGMIILLGTALGPIALAFGDSYLFMKLMSARVFLLLVSMTIGGILYGTRGVIVGVASSPIFYYPFQSVVYRKYSVWIPELDIIGIFASLFIVLTFFYLL